MRSADGPRGDAHGATEPTRVDVAQLWIQARIAHVRRALSQPRSTTEWLTFIGIGCFVWFLAAFVLTPFVSAIMSMLGPRWFAVPLALTLLIVALIVIGSIVARRRDLEREQAIGAIAARLGLRYSPRDPHGLKALPFEVIQTGGRASYRDLLWGELGGMPLAAFEVERYERTQILDRVLPYRFSCALTSLSVDAPHLIIERLGPDTHQLPPAMGEAPIVQTESAEFDRAFRVRSDDRRFALAVLDPSVMGWLLGTSGKWNVEVLGDRLLLYSPFVPLERLEDFFAQLRGFRDRFSAVAQHLAPPRWAAGDVLAAIARRSRRVRRPIQYLHLVLMVVFLVMVAVVVVVWSLASQL